jgi:broad specificity phosphatase PhoE
MSNQPNHECLSRVKLGLMRHLKTTQRYMTDQRMNSEEYAAWLKAYDASGIIPGPVDLRGVDWEVCFSSDLPRALETAKLVYPGEIIVTPLLREVTIGPFLHTRRRLPFIFWEIANRYGWSQDRATQPETRPQTQRRARQFIEMVMEQHTQNILAVTHGGFMWELRHELEQHGFTGDHFRLAENGQVYIYEYDHLQPPSPTP